MVVSVIAGLQSTPMEQIQDSISTLHESFADHKTRNVEFHLVQLCRL